MLSCLGLSCGAPQRFEPTPDLWRASREPIAVGAQRIELTRSTGSCWGVDSRSKWLEVRPDRVLLHAAGRPSVAYSPAWWQRARAQLNRGIRASLRPRAPGTRACEGRPNFVCRFSVRVDSAPPIDGCCTTNAAYKAFDSLDWMFDAVDRDLAIAAPRDTGRVGSSVAQ